MNKKKKLAIRGDHFKKDDIIKLLEELGGTNVVSNLDGSDPSAYYYIGGPGGDILSSRGSGRILGLECFTIDEFSKKYPFRVGDEVLYDGNIVSICGMLWQFGDILYYFYYKGVLRCGSKDSFKPKEMIEELIESASKDTESLMIDIPTGYEFAGIDDDKQQVILQKIHPNYPKTYEECCEILDYEPKLHTVIGYDAELIENFQTLKLCRDAYWKLAGDWRPITDQAIVNPTTYHVHYDGFVSLFCCHPGSAGKFLLFPTEEMAEKFSENFKDLIDSCKELLGYHG